MTRAERLARAAELAREQLERQRDRLAKIQAAQHAEESSLAAAIRTEEPVDFARADREIDVIDRSKLVKTFCHAPNLNNCFAVFHSDLNSTSTG